MKLKASQVAEDLSVTRFTVYHWIKTGVIPADRVIGIGQTIRLDAERLDALIRAGKLYRQRIPPKTRAKAATKRAQRPPVLVWRRA